MTSKLLCLEWFTIVPKPFSRKIYDCYSAYQEGEIAISFSGAEDVVLIDIASRIGKPFRVFSLDTGRLHAETYQFIETVRKHYNINIEICFPESATVQQLVNEKGFFSFFGMFSIGK